MEMLSGQRHPRQSLTTCVGSLRCTHACAPLPPHIHTQINKCNTVIILANALKPLKPRFSMKDAGFWLLGSLPLVESFSLYESVYVCEILYVCGYDSLSFNKSLTVAFRWSEIFLLSFNGLIG